MDGMEPGFAHRPWHQRAGAALGVASLRSGRREQPSHKNRSRESGNKNITDDFRLAESMIDCLIPPTHTLLSSRPG